MRLFLDTEFTSLEASSNLISIALVSEDRGSMALGHDRYFYAELSDGWRESDCTDWVQANVLAKLDRKVETTMTRDAAARHEGPR